MKRLLIGLLFCISVMAQNASETITVEEQIDQICKKYQAINPHKDIEQLVELDKKLRDFMIRTWGPGERDFSRKQWKTAWSEVGLYRSHYGGTLGYSEKLLVDAHEINPFSEFRKSTLFSEIMGEGTFHGLGEMPDIEAAYQYLEEFPNGPFAVDVSIILGNFYCDLFKVLKYLQEDWKYGYKYDCFSKYIDDSDLDEQVSNAQRLSIKYYSQALPSLQKSEPGGSRIKRIEKRKLQMEKGIRDHSWSFCAD